MIEAHRLSKSYGSFHALDDVSFRVDQGEVVGFLGPNGAGKSTTLRILAGFVGPTSGRVRIAGYDIQEDPLEARRAIGYMPETSPLYPEMRVLEYLAFRAELKGVRRKERREAVARALTDTRIDDVAEIMIGHLSKGYRQRVALADALLGDPPILILDEPTAGLDPNQIREVRALIQRLGETRAVLVSTHILSEAQATCTRAIVISHGRLVAEGTFDALRSEARGGGVRVVYRGDDDEVALRAMAPFSEKATFACPSSGVLTATFRDGVDGGDVTEAIVARLVTEGLGVREVTRTTATLEQVFAALTESGEMLAPEVTE